MNTPKIIVGVDVSADELVCASFAGPDSTRSRFSHRNSARGVKALLCRLSRLTDVGTVHVVMEATGNMHVRLQDALWEADIPCSVVQPLEVKYYARMKGVRNKTDQVDAALLARFGFEQPPTPSVPSSPACRELKQLGTTLRGLIKMRTMLKNQLSALGRLPVPERTCLKELKGMLRTTQRHIERIEQRQAELVQEQFSAELALLLSIKGIGLRTAVSLLAYAGDLSGFASPGRLAAYIGVNPSRHTSGTSLDVNAGISKRGNRHLRTLFYLGALSARRHNAACAALYERLISRGRTKKQALIAVAHKLIRQAWGVLANRKPYLENYGLQHLTS